MLPVAGTVTLLLIFNHLKVQNAFLVRRPGGSGQPAGGARACPLLMRQRTESEGAQREEGHSEGRGTVLSATRVPQPGDSAGTQGGHLGLTLACFIYLGYKSASPCRVTARRPLRPEQPETNSPTRVLLTYR